MVNKVCFCFPFFFAFPDPDSTTFAGVLPSSPSSVALAAGPAAPLLQADPTGVVSPKIFFNDWLPLTVAFCLPELDAGSSGNRAFDRDTGARACAGAFFCTPGAPRPGAEDDARKPEAALDDQGV